MLRNESVATIKAPEFVNLAPNAINPLISECEIKVLYLGKNRNGSYFDKETAERMANTLPGVPIVGAYRKDVDDFGDHGEVVHIENGEISFSCATKPYGFVAPDAKVWFKDYEDFDEFGNKVERTYLMTNGYLWTGMYPEIERCVTEGMGQSMELDGDTMDGRWAEDYEEQVEFFIVNDATFTKLCVLGDTVEPCFEGASVEAPNVSKTFSKDNFTHTLFDMMGELRYALQEGGSDMPEDSTVVEPTAEEVVELPAEESTEVVDAPEPEFAEKDEEKPEEGDSADEVDVDDKSDPEDEDEEREPEDKHALADEVDFESKFNEVAERLADLEARYAELEVEAAGLREFKLNAVRAEKEAVVEKYHMLSDEDKAEVVENLDSFSLEEIESKLALIYVNKNVDFDTIDGVPEVEDAPGTTFSINEINSADEVDPFIAALREANESL